MSTPDSQERLKEEAKGIAAKVTELVKDKDQKARIVRTICIYAGLVTETLLEYEEPDTVMEQAFHRIAELLKTDPDDDETEDELLVSACDIDHDTELGRHLARNVAKKLPKTLDDVHEIAIALVINDFPLWEKEGFARSRLLRILIEAVIASLTFEMAAQDFCDFLIEEYIAEGNRSPSDGIFGLAVVAGYYYNEAERQMTLPPGTDVAFTNVMVRESLRHGTPGSRNWGMLAAANDTEGKDIPEYIAKIRPAIDEFFVLIGLEDPLGRAVSVAKAVGRMVAVIAVEDVGQIHPSIAKSLAKTGMILGAKHNAEPETRSL